jgi:hypothetical protein
MVLYYYFYKWYNPAIAVSVFRLALLENTGKERLETLQKYSRFLTGQGRPNQYRNRFFDWRIAQLFTLSTDTKCHPETRSVDGAKRHQRSEGSREILRFAQNDKLCTNLCGGKICVKYY